MLTVTIIFIRLGHSHERLSPTDHPANDSLQRTNMFSVMIIVSQYKKGKDSLSAQGTFLSAHKA